MGGVIIKSNEPMILVFFLCVDLFIDWLQSPETKYFSHNPV